MADGPDLPSPPPEVASLVDRRLGALDGMRALAVVAVMLFHLDIAYDNYRPRLNPFRLAGGFLGVDVFFVLSGFLITTLLLREHEEHGSISLRSFYARRALRLFPALAVAIAFGLVGLAVLDATNHGDGIGRPTLSGLPYVIFYIGNWKAATQPGYQLGLFLHTWSLAIEEQFYLVAPICLIVALRLGIRRTRMAAGVLAIAAVEVTCRAVLAFRHHSVARLYYGTDTHSDGLLLGCAIALLLTSPRIASALSSKRGRRVLDGVALIGVLVVAGLMLRTDQLTPSATGLAIPCTVVATGAVLVSVVLRPPSRLRRVLELRPLVWIGRRSYGLYLYSFITFGLVFASFPQLARHDKDAIGIAASFVLAALSFRLVETPFLRLRHRFSRVARAPGRRSPPQRRTRIPNAGAD